MQRLLLVGLMLVSPACGSSTAGDVADASPPSADASGAGVGDAATTPPDATTDTCEPSDPCAHDDGCCPGSCDPSNDNDCSATGLPRLIVADAGGIKIWNNADELTDRPPDVTLTGPAGAPTALALYQNRLIAAAKDDNYPIYLYDDARGLTDGASYTDRIPTSAFAAAPPPGVDELEVDAQGNLWMLTGFDTPVQLRMLPQGASQGSGAGALVAFSHPWSQIPAMALDPVGNKLIGGQISGAGVLVWNDPLEQTGTSNENDWQLHDGTNSWAMTIHNDRLYAGSGNTIAVWNEISSVTGPASPDFSLSVSDSVWDLHARDDVLVASVRGASHSRVQLYDNVSSITGDTSPDVIIDDTATTSRKRSVLDANGNLYVLGSDGIYVYNDALGTPALRVKLTFGALQPNDFVIVE